MGFDFESGTPETSTTESNSSYINQSGEIVSKDTSETVSTEESTNPKNTAINGPNYVDQQPPHSHPKNTGVKPPSLPGAGKKRSDANAYGDTDNRKDSFYGPVTTSEDLRNSLNPAPKGNPVPDGYTSWNEYLKRDNKTESKEKNNVSISQEDLEKLLKETTDQNGKRMATQEELDQLSALEKESPGSKAIVPVQEYPFTKEEIQSLNQKRPLEDNLNLREKMEDVIVTDGTEQEIAKFLTPKKPSNDIIDGYFVDIPEEENLKKIDITKETPRKAEEDMSEEEKALLLPEIWTAGQGEDAREMIAPLGGAKGVLRFGLDSMRKGLQKAKEVGENIIITYRRNTSKANPDGTHDEEVVMTKRQFNDLQKTINEYDKRKAAAEQFNNVMPEQVDRDHEILAKANAAVSGEDQGGRKLNRREEKLVRKAVEDGIDSFPNKPSYENSVKTDNLKTLLQKFNDSKEPASAFEEVDFLVEPLDENDKEELRTISRELKTEDGKSYFILNQDKTPLEDLPKDIPTGLNPSMYEIVVLEDRSIISLPKGENGITRYNMTEILAQVDKSKPTQIIPSKVEGLNNPVPVIRTSAEALLRDGKEDVYTDLIERLKAQTNEDNNTKEILSEKIGEKELEALREISKEGKLANGESYFILNNEIPEEIPTDLPPTLDPRTNTFIVFEDGTVISLPKPKAGSENTKYNIEEIVAQFDPNKPEQQIGIQTGTNSEDIKPVSKKSVDYFFNNEDALKVFSDMLDRLHKQADKSKENTNDITNPEGLETEVGGTFDEPLMPFEDPTQYEKNETDNLPDPINPENIETQVEGTFEDPLMPFEDRAQYENQEQEEDTPEVKAIKEQMAEQKATFEEQISELKAQNSALEARMEEILNKLNELAQPSIPQNPPIPIPQTPPQNPANPPTPPQTPPTYPRAVGDENLTWNEVPNTNTPQNTGGTVRGQNGTAPNVAQPAQTTATQVSNLSGNAQANAGDLRDVIQGVEAPANLESPEQQRKERRLKRGLLIAGGLTGFGAVMIGGLGIAPTASIIAAAGSITSLGVSKFSEWKETRLKEKYYATQDPNEKAKIESKMHKWDKVRKAADNVKRFFTGGAIGVAAGSLVSGLFMGGEGLIDKLGSTPDAGSTLNTPVDRVPTDSRPNPFNQDPGSSPIDSRPNPLPGDPKIEIPEIPANERLVVNGRVNLPGSAWHGNLGGEPTVALPGGELNMTSYPGSDTNMAAHLLDKALAESGIPMSKLTEKLDTQGVHILINKFRDIANTGVKPELTEALGRMSNPGAKDVISMINPN